MIPYKEIYGFPRYFGRFLGEKGILKRNRLISTGAVVGAGCPPTSISGVRPHSVITPKLMDFRLSKGSDILFITKNINHNFGPNLNKFRTKWVKVDV